VQPCNAVENQRVEDLQEKTLYSRALPAKRAKRGDHSGASCKKSKK